MHETWTEWRGWLAEHHDLEAEVWLADAWKTAGGANSRAGMGVDTKRAIVYVPTGSASPDSLRGTPIRSGGALRRVRAAPRGRGLSAGAAHGTIDTGPAPDHPDFAPVMRQAAALLARIWAAVPDAGFEREPALVLCRETLGIRRTAIRLDPRRHGRKWPRTPRRRTMRRRFPWRLHGRRQQAESVFSRDKRRLGSALTARGAAHQREMPAGLLARRHAVSPGNNGPGARRIGD